MPQETPPPLLVTTNNADRLAALRQYDIVDTPPEVAFNDLTQLAAQICQTPVALITFVDGDRQWFKSSFGAEETESPLEHGFCPVVVQQGKPLIISDTLANRDFATNPAVFQPGVRFYAGIPLITADGYSVGTLCVLDFTPRQLKQEQIAGLHALSRQVMSQLELRLALRKVTQTNLALTAVSCGVAATVGETFFSSLVQHFTSALGVQYAYIGLLTNHEPETIATISVCHQGCIIDDFEYLLRDTPCQQVIQQRSLCCYPQNVQAQFPNAPLLAPLQIESYAAIPIFDFKGTPLGLLGIMDTKPLEAIQLAESLLTIFGVRIATELERQHAEVKQAQLFAREQEARQEAEAANRIKDEFLAVLSHELRTPLNPILGWAKLLKDGRCPPEKMQQALDTIERNAQLQTQLIEDLLDISRIMRGKLVLNTASVDLQLAIAAALDTVRLAADTKGIMLQTHLESSVALVVGDSARLQQAIWNLLSNAVKFTPTGGRVEVRLVQINNRAQLQVSDTGKGINPEFLPYVFEHFRQEDGATTRKFGGLGLGLAIARQIVELHGGRIWVESPGEDRGATFTIELPVLHAANPVKEVTPASSK
ncbi:ATP-binding protein [Scytonema sp. NUACC26]|uniref:GAF domain-containing sensor histidine kinase n=1 Tax=Scytonema sp. NUACC26 TaxID=3140176 RepID=UPI0034DC5768